MSHIKNCQKFTNFLIYTDIEIHSFDVSQYRGLTQTFWDRPLLVLNPSINLTELHKQK